jgi:hypothetical protein
MGNVSERGSAEGQKEWLQVWGNWLPKVKATHLDCLTGKLEDQYLNQQRLNSKPTVSTTK